MTENKSTNRGIGILIKVLAFIFLLIFTFLLSYCGVSKWYTNRLNKRDAAQKQAEDETAQVEAEESVENCSFTMIYLDNPDTEEVDYCALKVFNRLNQEMSIFMIPTDSKLTMSSKLLKSLNKKSETEVPQELFLSSIGTYYTDNKTKYKMTTKAVQELIGGVAIDSYEALDYDSLIQMIDLAEPVKCKLSQMITYTDEMGESVKLTPGEEHEIDGRKALAILTYSDGFGAGDGGRIERTSTYLMEYVTAITTNYSKQQMSEYLSDYCNLIVTNGSMSDASSYLEDILKLNEENLSFYTLKGTQKEEEYTLDSEKIQEDMKILMGEEAFELATTEQTEETTTAAEIDSEEGTTEGDQAEISSKDKSITIYNGAYINGLAGKWRTRLSEEGYQIEGIYNYSGGTRENGKIIVKEEGMGEDLKNEFFPNAVIEVGIPDDGADIQIILGRSEDF